MYCCQCGYDLRGTPEHRCPECGQPYNPLNESTFVSRPPEKLLSETWGVMILQVFSAALAIAAMVLIFNDSVFGIDETVVLAVPLVVAVFFIQLAAIVIGLVCLFVRWRHVAPEMKNTFLSICLMPWLVSVFFGVVFYVA